MFKYAQQVPHGAFRFLIFVSRPHWKPAVLAILFILIADILGTLVPYIFKRIVDSANAIEIYGSQPLIFWVSMYVVFGFVASLAYRGSGYSGMRWVTSARATAREVLSAHVTKHSHSFFSNRFAGSVGSKLSNASNGADRLAQDLLWGWIGFLLDMVVGLGLVFYTSPYIGIIFLLWLLVIAPINIILVRKRIPLSIDVQEKETVLRGQTVDILTNINAMHDYARRTFEIGRLFNLISERRRAGLKNWMYAEHVLLLNSVLESIFVAGMIFTSIYLWTQGAITAGDIILVLTLIFSIRGTLAFVGQRFNSFAETIGEVKEGLEEVLNPHEIVDAPLATKLRVSKGEIVFENVAFTYGTQNIFEDLSLHISPGERVGLVGRSGAGKSTLMKLITRQYDITGGKILIDGQDIALVTQESLRSSIAIVPQDPLLFHRSLKDNIKYGNLNATDKDIKTASGYAQAHDFIDKLPSKYETLVGERGIKLSGGERQRVAIARAFLKDAKILLLDEATSSLDSASEVAIQDALQRLMKGKTVIAIAHRLSTLRAMDRVIVLDGGEIVEDGTHNELLSRGGVYAELWEHQAGGFIQDK